MTLWRSTLGDLFKLTAITAGVLVLVIALGAAVKPLSDGLLDASDLPKFVMIAMVPMLAYALPFAGGFASTLVYYRIANENEAVAAHAGGISHRSLVAPAVVMAIVLTAGLVVLNEEVIPGVLRSMQRMITTDVARQLLQGVARGEAVQFKNALPGGGESRTMIYADKAWRIRNPSGGATDQIALSNFAYVDLDKDGKPIREVSGTLANVWLFPGSGDSSEDAPSYVTMRCENWTVYANRAGQGRFNEDIFTWPVPNTFKEKVSFMSWRELLDLRANPKRLSWVEQQRQRVISSLAQHQTLAMIRARGAAGQPIEFVDSQGHLVVLRAPLVTVADGRAMLGSPPGGVIRVDRTRTSTTGVSEQVLSALTGLLVAEDVPSQQSPTFKLVLDRVRVRDSVSIAGGADAGADAEQPQVVVERLTPVPDAAAALSPMHSDELLELAEARVAAGEKLGDGPKQLRKALQRVERLVLGRQNERMAMAASCFLMILTGAVTALLLSRRLPLAVYLWTFLPALATIVTISGGQQMVQQSGVMGLTLMWGGVAALGAYTAVVFAYLAKH